VGVSSVNFGEGNGPSRRRVLQGGLAAGVAGVGLAALGETGASAVVQPAARLRGSSGIRPFRVAVPRQQLIELRRRIAAVRWPSAELVSDRSQGVQLRTTQALAKYWLGKYDWNAFEAKFNKLPQYKTEIDGVDIHFIHVRSPHKDALPLIMTHGWPGSIIELIETIGPLTNPTMYGGTAADAFHLVLPSIPGFGFSSQPTELGWSAGHTATAWVELMTRLGYTRYVAQGGDVGSAVTDTLGRLAPPGLQGIHLNLLASALGGAEQPNTTAEERAATAAVTEFRTSGNGYLIEQSTRPQTIGYALQDSPVALAAWMLDHDTDSYYKISRAFLGGPAAGNLTPDHILDNITMYWLTGTGVSSAREYWESTQARIGAPVPPPVTLPVGFSAFPGEIFQAPRSWVEKAYPTLTYYNKPPRGGHFAAWEEPTLFTNELRAAFRPLR
jgi:pimeloyl-ACP methyl ester carboxylesterase